MEIPQAHPNVPDVEEEDEKEHPIPKENNPTFKEPKTEEFVSHHLMDTLLGKIPDTMDPNSTKRNNTSDHLDLDKENPRHVEDTSLTLVTSLPTQGEWRKFEKKNVRKV